LIFEQSALLNDLYGMMKMMKLMIEDVTFSLIYL